MGTRYDALFNTRETPQTQPIPGAVQVQNDAGGYVFGVDHWTALQRFLILGVEDNTYYATKRDLVMQAGNGTLKCVAEDGERVVRTVVAVSHGGRAPKNDAALFVLAICAGVGNEATRKAAFGVLRLVARTSTHLFQFLNYVQGFRGWGRGLRNAVAEWYLDREPQSLALQLTKYQSREGWTHLDVLRKAHPTPVTEDQRLLFQYVKTGGFKYASFGDRGVADYLEAVELVKHADALRLSEVLDRIVAQKLPREVLPTALLNRPEVWEAMLPNMPPTAMLRNLATMTKLGVLAPLNDNTACVCERLTDSNALQRARIHPLSMLVALGTYGRGHGDRGTAQWTPVTQIVDALDEGFYTSFGAVEPTGKRHLLGVDWSGSMSLPQVLGGFSPAYLAAAMALVTHRVETKTEIVAFASTLKKVSLSSKMRLDDVYAATYKGAGEGTDCAIPIMYALQRQIPVDVFVIYTDSQTWAGPVHVTQALQKYRSAMVHDAKLVNVQMVYNTYSTVREEDDESGTLNVVGIDTATPTLISEFAKGTF